MNLKQRATYSRLFLCSCYSSHETTASISCITFSRRYLRGIWKKLILNWSKTQHTGRRTVRYDQRTSLLRSAHPRCSKQPGTFQTQAGSRTHSVQVHVCFVLRIVNDGHRADCPFCEQSLANPEPKAVVDAYIEYFNDAEEKHKSELRLLYSELNGVENVVKELEYKLTGQKSQFDVLKAFLPSQKDTQLDNFSQPLAGLREAVTVLKGLIQS